MILGVGLGTEETTDYARFGERAENNILSEMLDESLEIITGLWSVDVSSIGENITGFVRRCFYPAYATAEDSYLGGRVLASQETVLLAARWDGVIPLKLPVRPLEPRDVREIMSFIRKHGTVRSPFRPREYWLDNGEKIRTRFGSIRIQGDLVAREFVR